MKIRKIPVSAREIDSLTADFGHPPTEPIGDHLSDDELIRYAMDNLQEQGIERIDGHLASCPNCTVEMERLLENYEVWLGTQGKKRLDTLKKRYLLARALYGAARDFGKPRLAASDKGSRRIWEWQDDVLHVSVTQDENGNWAFRFSSRDLDLQDKRFHLRLTSLEREVVLKRVSQDEVGAKIVIPAYERPANVTEISFDIDKRSFSLRTGDSDAPEKTW